MLGDFASMARPAGIDMLERQPAHCILLDFAHKAQIAHWFIPDGK